MLEKFILIFNIFFLMIPPFAVKSYASEKIYYLHNDHLDNQILATDSDGNEVTRTEYFPFGSEYENTNNIKAPHQFTGKEYEDEVDLYYFGARYYNPKNGRFISIDPVRGNSRNPQSWNRYAYALNNPIRYIDPNGMEAKISEFYNLSRAYDSNLEAGSRFIYNSQSCIFINRVKLGGVPGFQYIEENSGQLVGYYFHKGVDENVNEALSYERQAVKEYIDFFRKFMNLLDETEVNGRVSLSFSSQYYSNGTIVDPFAFQVQPATEFNDIHMKIINNDSGEIVEEKWIDVGRLSYSEFADIMRERMEE